MPVHDLLVATGVRAVLHGHDHIFDAEDYGGVRYVELPLATDPERLHRSGDAGWVCSCVAGDERVRSVRVLANVSSRVSVGARGLTARRAHIAKGAGRATLAAARAAAFA